MKSCVSTYVGTWTNWLTFEPDPDYSPDAGTGLLSLISYKRCYGRILRWENPTYTYWRRGFKMVLEPAAAVRSGFTTVLFTYSYACREPQLASHETASSSTEWSRDKPPFSFVRGHDFTMWDIVWVSLQGHRSASVSRHFLLQALQCPCSVRRRFSRDHCCRGRSKPGCQIVGSHTSWELTTWVDFQLCLHRLLVSTGCKSRHSGFLDVSRSNGGLRTSGWISQLSCLMIFSCQWQPSFVGLAVQCWRALEAMEKCRMEGTRDETHGRVQLHIDRTCVSRAWPDWGAVLCCWIAKCQSRWPQRVGAGAPAWTG